MPTVKAIVRTYEERGEQRMKKKSAFSEVRPRTPKGDALLRERVAMDAGCPRSRLRDLGYAQSIPICGERKLLETIWLHNKAVTTQ